MVSGMRDLIRLMPGIIQFQNGVEKNQWILDVKLFCFVTQKTYFGKFFELDQIIRSHERECRYENWLPIKRA